MTGLEIRCNKSVMVDSGAMVTQKSKSDKSEMPDRRLLEILVCPLTKTTLEYEPETQELISRSAGLAYPIRDGIPIMLPEEARELNND